MLNINIENILLLIPVMKSNTIPVPIIDNESPTNIPSFNCEPHTFKSKKTQAHLQQCSLNHKTKLYKIYIEN